MNAPSFYIIQIETYNTKAVGILHMRYLSGHCRTVFNALVATGNEKFCAYKVLLLFVPDGSRMHECVVAGKKFIADKLELSVFVTDMLLYGEQNPFKSTPNYQD